MTHLRIELNNIPETVSADIIRKLYETALSISEPNEGEEDSAYLSGTLLTPYAYKSHVDYLTERFSNLYINVTSDYYIEFEDPNVEQCLKTANIGNEVGITYADAAAADIGTIFKNNTDITSFNEFKYFTYANQNPANELFSGCTNLTSIDLSNVTKLSNSLFKNSGISGVIGMPNLVNGYFSSVFENCTGITEISSLGPNIGASAFRCCSSLTSFDFDNVQTINSNAFYECSNLTIKLNCPNLNNLGSQSFVRSGITEIENLGFITALNSYLAVGTFSGCVNLQKVLLPNTIRTLYEKSFSNCTNLTYIYGLENITTLGYCCFSGVISINNVLNFSNLTTITTCAFGDERGSTSRVRKQIYLPKLIASHEGAYYSNWYTHAGTFQNVNTDLLYFRDIQAFHPYDFCYTTCTALVINNVTPPSWNNNSDRTDDEQQAQSGWLVGWREYVLEYSTITNIYVPDSAVTTYQQDSNWSTVANKILPLSLLAKVATEADLQVGQVALIEAYM